MAFAAAVSYLALKSGVPQRLLRVKATNSTLAVTNLSSQIDSLEKLIAQHPERHNFKKQLFGLLLTRSQFFGTYDDPSRMLSLTVDAPTTICEHLLRAQYLTAIHDFDAATAVITPARSLDHTNPEVDKANRSNPASAPGEASRAA